MKVILPHQISLGRMTVLMTMVLSVKCTGMLENTVLSKRYIKKANFILANIDAGQ